MFDFRRSLSLLAALVLTGAPACIAATGDELDNAELTAPEGEEEGEEGHEHDPAEDDVLVAPDEVENGIADSENALADGTPQVVYVNFDGPVIKNCGGYCSDAPTNRSWAIGAHFGKSQIDFAPYTNSAARTSVVMRLRDHFKRYKVDIVTKRPASGKYTMLVISPTTGPNHGVAPLNCNNSNRNDIAFVYKIGKASSPTMARYAAHELGHSFGLSHVKSKQDFMQWASSGTSWTKSTYDTAHPSGKCFSGNTQDAHALLVRNIGLR